MFRTPFGNWTCAVCINSFPQNTASGTIEGTQVCSTCIRRIFSLAIERETNFPPRWGRSILHPESFSHILDAGFIRTYNTKAAEWRLAVDQRVYCQHRRGAQGACSRFLGAKEQRTVCRRCGDCTGFTCMRCLKSFGSRAGSGNEIQISHECNTQAEEKSRQQAFSGLQKGRHYQDCPRCKRRIELRDGCSKYYPLLFENAFRLLNDYAQMPYHACAVRASATTAAAKQPNRRIIGVWDVVRDGEQILCRKMRSVLLRRWLDDLGLTCSSALPLLPHKRHPL